MTRPGPALGACRRVARAFPLAAPRLLRNRLRKGKDLPQLWREEPGEPSLTRPDGPRFWLHAVGLGKRLALRGRTPRSPVIIAPHEPERGAELAARATALSTVAGGAIDPLAADVLELAGQA